MLEVSLVTFRSALKVPIFRQMLTAPHPVYLLQGVALACIAVLAGCGLAKLQRRDVRLLGPAKRRAACISLPRWALRVSILALVTGLLPAAMDGRMWYYADQDEPIVLTAELFSMILSPVYLGLVILAFGVLQYYLLEFLMVGRSRAE